MRYFWRRIATFAGIAALLVAGLVVISAERGLDAGRERLAARQFSAARREFGRYLWLHPQADQCRLLLAEAFARDDRLEHADAVAAAVSVLQSIPLHSPAAPEARTREARLELFVRARPGAAEKLLREAAARDPRRFDAAYLSWITLSLTGRTHLADGHFWRCHELAPESQRGPLLLEWFLCQFAPLEFAAHHDRWLGVLGENDAPTRRNVFDRLVLFLQHEPGNPEANAALAQFYLEIQDVSSALKLLGPEAEAAAHLQNDVYRAAYLEVQLRAGNQEAARRVFADWTPARRDFQYWRLAGMVHDEIDRDDAAAVDAFRRATESWPGGADAGVWHRLAGCLARRGDAAQAEQTRAHAEAIDEAVNRQSLAALTERVLNGLNPAVLAEVIALYRTLGQSREADAWSSAFRSDAAPLAAPIQPLRRLELDRRHP